MRKPFLTLSILCTAWIAMAAPAVCDTIIDLPESGTDVSSIRCQGSIVSTGDPITDVVDKCGEPVARGHLPNRNTYDVWVYQMGSGEFVYYLGFRNRRLERIYSISCVKKDPYCR